MLHVVLDANAIGVDPPLGKLEHRVLLDAHRSGTIVLVVPQLALREAVNGWKREIKAQSAKLIALQRKIAQLHPAYSLSVPKLDRDSAAERLLANHIAMLETADVRLPPTPNVSHEQLIARALDRRQPFDDKGSGYRDALLWQIVRNLAAEGHDVVLISNDSAAFADERKAGGPLAESLIAELHGGNGRLFAHVRDAIDDLGLFAHEAVEAARTVIESEQPKFAELLRSLLVEELSHGVHRWSTQELVNPFTATGASLGLAHDAVDVKVLEARRTEHDRLEVSVLLEVRQFVTIFVPDALWEQMSHLGLPFASDDDVAGVEIDAKVRHLCRVVLDPVTDRVLEAEAVEVVAARR